jgi:hypothetical protein
MIRHYIGRMALAIAVAGCSAVWAVPPSNAQYSIPSSTRNSGVGDMTSAQHKLSSSVGDGFGQFSMSSATHTLSPGFWGSVLQLAPASATITVSPATVPDNGTPLVFTVALNPPPAVATPVAIASAVVSGSMTGVTNNCTAPVLVGTSGIGTCTISANNTVAIDGPVTATVTLAAGAGWVLGTPSVATGTITDDDRAVGVTAPNIVVNNGTNAVFNITCTGAATATVSYSFSGNYTPLPPNGGPTVVTCGTPLVITIPTNSDPILHVRALTLTLADPTPFTLVPGQGAATITVIDEAFFARPIPALSTLLLILLGLLVTSAAGFGIRRATQRPTSTKTGIPQ